MCDSVATFGQASQCGGGRHFCLGAHVARTQLRALFGELLRQLPDIQAGDPAYVPGNFIHAIRSMPATQ